MGNINKTQEAIDARQNLHIAIAKQFKKESDKTMWLTDKELIDVYIETLSQLCKKIPGNVFNETYLSSYVNS